MTKDTKDLKEVLDLLTGYPIESFEFNGLKIKFGEKLSAETDVKITTSKKPKEHVPTEDELLLYATEHYDAVVLERQE